jgi:hypothetical protein
VFYAKTVSLVTVIKPASAGFLRSYQRSAFSAG